MKRRILLFFALTLALSGSAQIDFTDGLKSYHPMNNDYYNVTGNIAQNSNINTNYHQLFYNATFGNDSATVTNNAGYFSGANRVNIFGKLLNTDTDDFTIDFWFKSSSTADQVFYWEGTLSGFRIYIRLEPSASRIRTNIGNQGGGGSVHEVSTTSAYNDGFWHHYAITMTNGLDSKVYVDGVEVASNTQAYTLGTTTNFTRIGCRDDIAQFLTGSMDNMKVWDRALTPAEISGIYNSPKIVITSASLNTCVNAPLDLTFDVVGGSSAFEATNIFYAQISDINGTFEYPVNLGSVSGTTSGTVSITIPETISTGSNYKIRIVATDYPMVSENTASITVTNANSFPGYDILSGLIFHYKFDGNAEDFSGLGNDGTMAGTPTATNDRFGIANSATAFNSPDRIDIGQPYPIRKYDNTTNAISFSFWLNQNSTPGDFGYIFSSWSPGSLDGMWIGTTNAGRVRFRINGGAYVEAIHTNGQWQHFVCVYNGANLRIYRDGVQIATAAVGGQFQLFTDIEMGQNTQGGGAGQLNGSLDDFRIYNRSLGDDEVLTLFNNGLATNNGPLCDGDDVELYGPNYAGLAYDWSGPNSFISNIEDPMYSPFNAIANTGEYSLTLTLDGCVGPPNFTELNSTVTPVASVLGDTICAGNSATISASGSADDDYYIWYSDVLGTTIINDSTAAINVMPAVTDTFYVNIKPGPLCQSAVMPVVVLVNQLPGVIANATDLSLCIGDNVTLTGSGAQTYLWDNAVTNGVAFSPVATATYTVTGTDLNGCENSDQIEVVVSAYPNTSAISGDDMVSCDTDSENYSVINTVGSTYLWSVPAGAIITSGQGTNSITVDFNGNFGLVSVIETNTGDCEGTQVDFGVACNLSINESSSVMISVYPNPAHEFIQMSVAFEGDVVIRVYDSSGKLIRTQSENADSNLQINVSDLSRGIYFGELSNNGKIYRFKFSKN